MYKNLITFILLFINASCSISNINEVDLKTALKESIIKGAALDVYSVEPAENNVLFGVNNLILTPHIAASTEEAQLIVAKQIAEQISEFFNTGKITNSV